MFIGWKNLATYPKISNVHNFKSKIVDMFDLQAVPSSYFDLYAEKTEYDVTPPYEKS